MYSRAKVIADHYWPQPIFFPYAAQKGPKGPKRANTRLKWANARYKLANLRFKRANMRLKWANLGVKWANL